MQRFQKKKDLVEGAIVCSCPSLCVSGQKVNVLKSMNYEWLTTEIIPQIITVKKSYQIWQIGMVQNLHSSWNCGVHQAKTFLVNW